MNDFLDILYVKLLNELVFRLNEAAGSLNPVIFVCLFFQITNFKYIYSIQDLYFRFIVEI